MSASAFSGSSALLRTKTSLSIFSLCDHHGPQDSRSCFRDSSVAFSGTSSKVQASITKPALQPDAKVLADIPAETNRKAKEKASARHLVKSVRHQLNRYAVRAFVQLSPTFAGTASIPWSKEEGLLLHRLMRSTKPVHVALRAVDQASLPIADIPAEKASEQSRATPRADIPAKARARARTLLVTQVLALAQWTLRSTAPSTVLAQLSSTVCG